MSCYDCMGMGFTECHICGGSGTIINEVDDYSVEETDSTETSNTKICWLCNGECEIPCPTCGGY